MRNHSKCPTYLFVLPWSLQGLGGVNQVVINLAREMVKSGSFEPVVLIVDWNAVDPVWEEIHGLKTVRWRVRGNHVNMSIKERIAFLLWRRRFRPAFYQFCRDQRVAVVNPHFPDSSAFTLNQLVGSFERPVSYILSFHGADLSSLRTLSTSAIAQWRKLLLRVDGVVVCSNDLGNKVIEAFGDKVVPCVIYNGLDVDAFVEMKGTEKAEEERIILNVAKFEKKKGQDILVQAFADIADDYEDVILVLVGATDKALPALKELCVRRGIKERVHFFQDMSHQHIAEFFRRATIFALPSRQEPFGIVLLEAGAFSLPVVASRVGGIPEILTDGITGRLVAPDNPAELALCLRSFLDSPTAAQSLGVRLHQHVLSSFTWAVAHKKYIALTSRGVNGVEHGG